MGRKKKTQMTAEATTAQDENLIEKPEETAFRASVDHSLAVDVAASSARDRKGAIRSRRAT